MPICDGATCNREIAWRLTPTSLQHPAGNVTSFSVQRAQNTLTTVLAAAGCWNLRGGPKKVVFKNLCRTCWEKQCMIWGDVGTYGGARAKTDSTGLYFQVHDAAFRSTQGPGYTYSKGAILSCAIHELMHFWSYNSVGIQSYNRRVNVDWDELVADTLAYRVYSRMFPGVQDLNQYATPYNQYCRCMELAGSSFQGVFGKFWRNDGGARAKLPFPVAEYIEKNSAQGMALVKAGCTPILQKSFQEYLFTWFFNGPMTAIIDKQGTRVTIDDFLANINDITPTGRAYPAYDGNNTLHVLRT